MPPVKLLVISNNEQNCELVRKNIDQAHSVEHRYLDQFECECDHGDLCSCGYDIIIIQPKGSAIDILNKILSNSSSRPHIFVYNGQKIPYDLMKSLLKLGINGLIEDNDMSQMINSVNYMSRAKDICNKLLHKANKLEAQLLCQCV